MRLGLVGKSLGHSYSKDYFEKKFMKLTANHSYKLFELADITGIRTLVETEKLDGFNVTIPYKQTILDQLDQLDPAASSIAAVNTVLVNDGKLKGYNTDLSAFANSILPYIREESMAMIFGNGGASQAIQYALKQLEVPYVLVARSAGLSYNSLNAELISSYSILINTTSVGMYPEHKELLPLPYEGFHEGQLAYDLIYNPEKSSFLEQAAKRGAQTKNGLEMLHGQAEAAWKLWSANAGS